ncbi:hypothetical protein [Roseibium sp. MMSF_3544]|uniref:hypothetical protein n=1 Tax=unclassified Roseibium TaxID=2629323 RepID=UPI00273F3C1E|nr:hypothetical protein [Roseibium sp. MMSF_3544]
MSAAMSFFVIPALSRDRGGTNASAFYVARTTHAGSPIPDLRFAASGMTMERKRQFG